jgi:opacity protein-like surface antigen
MAKVAESGFSFSFKVSGFGVGAAFHQELSPDWNFVARLGLAQMKAKVVGTGTTTNQSASASDSKMKLYTGLGVGYKLSKATSLDLAYDVSSAELLDEKLTVVGISAGLTFQF